MDSDAHPPDVDDRTVDTAEGTDGEDADGRRRSLRDGAAHGVKRGVHATAVMTLFRTPVSRTLPPPTRLLAELFGGSRNDYRPSGLLLHLVYGAGAGAVFGALFGPVSGEEAVQSERRGAVLGTLYGLLLSGFGIEVVLGRLLGSDLNDHERFVFHVSHVVYGLSLGVAVGSDLGDGSEP